MLQRCFLRLDAARETELAVQWPGLAPGGEQSFALDAPERMSGMQQRDAEQQRQVLPDVSCIGVMAVDHIGQATLAFEIQQAAVGQLVEMVPEQFLAQVAA